MARRTDKWFVGFVLDAEKIPPIIYRVQRLGVDLGVKCLVTVSDGSPSRNYFSLNGEA